MVQTKGSLICIYLKLKLRKKFVEFEKKIIFRILLILHTKDTCLKWHCRYVYKMIEANHDLGFFFFFFFFFHETSKATFPVYQQFRLLIQMEHYIILPHYPQQQRKLYVVARIPETQYGSLKRYDFSFHFLNVNLINTCPALGSWWNISENN